MTSESLDIGDESDKKVKLIKTESLQISLGN